MPSFFRLVLAASFIIAVLSPAGCSSGEGGAPPPTNVAPTANAGADQTASEGETVFLTATASVDADGTVAGFSWMQTAGADVALTGAETAQARFQAPLVDGAATLTFRLTVTDDAGARNADDVSVTVVQAPRSQVVEREIRFDDTQRIFSLYTPAGYVAGAPAVLLLHGGGQNMRQMFDPGVSAARWVGLSEREGFLLIAPNGFNEADGDGLGDNQSWNDLRDNSDDPTSKQDDAGFILAVLETVRAARGHDPGRVFATGSSNGGMMAMRLLVETPVNFFGAAAFIAALPQETIQDPLSGTPIMLFNGTDDPLVTFGGGPVSGNRASTRSVPDTVDYFLRATNADRGSASLTRLPDADPGDGCEIFETIYVSSAAGPAVTFYEARGGGHAIPDPALPPFSPALEAFLGKRCRDVAGVDLAFAFFDALD